MAEDPLGRVWQSVCSQFAAITSKSRASHWARFSAPPETVERLTVVIPPFAPMDDVPVSR